MNLHAEKSGRAKVRVSGWPGIGQASLERHHRQWWDDEAGKGGSWLGF